MAAPSSLKRKVAPIARGLGRQRPETVQLQSDPLGGAGGGVAAAPGCPRTMSGRRAAARSTAPTDDAAATPGAVGSVGAFAVGRDPRVPAERDGAGHDDHDAAARCRRPERYRRAHRRPRRPRASSERPESGRRGAVDDRGAADAGVRAVWAATVPGTRGHRRCAAEPNESRLEAHPRRRRRRRLAGACARRIRTPSPRRRSLRRLGCSLRWMWPVSERERAGHEDPVAVGVDLCPAGTVRRARTGPGSASAGSRSGVRRARTEEAVQTHAIGASRPGAALRPSRPVVPGWPAAPLGPAGPAGPRTP